MSGTTRADVQRWLDRYLAAWNSNDPAEIGALFTDDANYRFEPYDQPVQGREKIVAGWLEALDKPGTWSAELAPFMVEGDRAIVTGTTSYTSGKVFSNLWVLRMDGDRCSDFTEWYRKHPA